MAEISCQINDPTDNTLYPVSCGRDISDIYARLRGNGQWLAQSFLCLNLLNTVCCGSRPLIL